MTFPRFLARLAFGLRSTLVTGVSLAAFLVLPGSPPAEAQEPAGRRRLTSLRGNERAPAWSPDGRQVAFEADESGNWDLYVLEMASGTVRNLTAHPAADHGPQFSPDGRSLAFWSDRDGWRGIHVLDLASGAVRRVTEAETGEAAPAWSPDGRTLAFAVGTPPETDLSLADSSGAARPRALTRMPGRELWPRFSPDGEWVAFFSRHHAEDDEIYRVRADGSERRRVTRRPGHDFCPAWSPDGRLLAAAIVDESGPAIGIFSTEGRLLATVGRGLERATHPAWAPDGMAVAFAGRRAGAGYDILMESVPGLKP